MAKKKQREGIQSTVIGIINQDNIFEKVKNIYVTDTLFNVLTEFEYDDNIIDVNYNDSNVISEICSREDFEFKWNYVIGEYIKIKERMKQNG